MMVATKQFGTVDVPEERMVLFPAGVLNLPGCCHCVVIGDPGSTPLQWLICVERPECALTILDPVLVLEDAVRPAPPQGDETLTFVVATPGSGDVAWWLDLRHPILINAAEMTGEQVTLDDPSLPERHPVARQQLHETTE